MADELIGGMAALRARLAQMRGAIENPQPSLLRAAVVALDSAKEHIEVGGPGWAPNLSGTPLLRATGPLFNSLTAGGAGNVMRLASDSIVTGTNLTVGDGLSLGMLLQGGTGIYGPTGQKIVPKNKKALAFSSGGTSYLLHSVKGSPKREFLYIDDQIATRIRDVFAQDIMGGSGADH